MKLKVCRDADLYDDGVEQVWIFLCPDKRCQDLGVHRVSTLYWENAVRAAGHHIAYHKSQGRVS